MKKKTKVVNCRVNEELYEQIKIISEEVNDDNVTISTVVQTAITEYVKIRSGEKSIDLINHHIVEAINSAIILNTKKIKKDINQIEKNLKIVLFILKDNLQIDEELLNDIEEQLSNNLKANI
ncbi:MAG: hypothetical protein ACK5NF_04040 [Bacilli bacterium]